MVTWLLLRSDDERAEAAELTGLHPRPWAVLELLLLNANRVVATDEIIDQLWPDDPPANARNSVQRFVADIRAGLGQRRTDLQTTGAGYCLTVADDDLDLARVRALRRQADAVAARDGDTALRLLEEAITHFGPIDPSAAPTEAAARARRSFEELRLQLIDERTEARLAAGDGAKLVEELRALADEHPYREHLWGQLMRALRADGQRVEALRVFEQLRRRLAEDVGIGPSNELCQLELQILTESDGLDRPTQDDAGPTPPADHPTDGSERHRPGDLVGRDREWARVVELLTTNRVVTVTGPGGVGKTRLVTEVARLGAGTRSVEGPELTEPTEPVVIRLAEAGGSDQVPVVVAAALGISTEALDPDGAIDEVVAHLERTPGLLVLDNAEHVLDAVRRLVDRAVERTDCRFLISSRERIGLPIEQLVTLGPLSLPTDDDLGRSEAEQLFQLRASAVDAPLNGQGHTVAAICRALDGLPLALELAASQLAHIGLQDLLDRLDARRLHLSGLGGQSARHSSLASMMEWSWDLLSPEEIALLEQLAVFNSPIDIDAVEDVAGDGAFPILTSLVARNLVTSTVTDGRARFSLLETVRLYALTKAEADGRLAACRDAHAAYLRRFLDRWSVVELNAWLDTIEAIEVHHLEYDPAIDWLDRQGRTEDVIEFVTRVTGLWARRGPGDLLWRWADRLIELERTTELGHEHLVSIAVVAAESRFRFSDHEGMAEFGERIVELEDLEATDLGTPFMAFYGTAIYTFGMDELSLARVETAHRRAATTPTRVLNQAQTEMWLGCCQLMDRRFDEALASFTSVLARTDRPGGVVLWSELGRVTALHLLGRADEATAAMATIRSADQHSIWDYAIDIVRAIVAAGAASPDDVDGVEAARTELVAAARRRIREQRAASRDDFQIGFGLLAAMEDHADLADELLADAMAQSPVTSALLINHLHPEPMDDGAWAAVWRTEVIGRILSLAERLEKDLPPVEDELARWAPGTPT